MCLPVLRASKTSKKIDENQHCQPSGVKAAPPEVPKHQKKKYIYIYI